MLVVKEKKKRLGKGIINTLIDSLPFEAHIPGGYRYCGPGTKLSERLKRGDKPINDLDARCMAHDVRYSQNKDLAARHEADRELIEDSWKIATDSSKSLGERAAAYLVTNVMKGKMAVGGRIKKKDSPRQKGVGRGVASSCHHSKKEVEKRQRKNKKRGVDKIKLVGPRVIPLPKSGGLLKYIGPILTGLSTVASVAGTANDLLKALEKLKDGKGVNKRVKLAPFKKGWGLYLRPYEPKNY